MSIPAAAREVVRNIANAVQLRLDKRVHRAAKNAAVMLAANQSVARDLRQSLSVAPLVQLETGVETRAITRRRERDPHEPLNILWAGRLQPWKGLPLLLRALAELPAERRYRLRLMGEGPCLSRWQRLGRRLGISQNIEWIGWPEYAEQLPQYDWADVFAFTSLRDTSGTGLLEALAAGAPIVGLNHQGAADIMTESCAIRVDVSSPARAIAGFRDAIARLSLDPSLLESLRQGARERSADFSWDRQWDETRLLYEGIVSRCMPTSRSSVSSSLSATAKPDALLVEA
jgi:glycosyltransferase involved in cell wall biosynthesis